MTITHFMETDATYIFFKWKSFFFLSFGSFNNVDIVSVKKCRVGLVYTLWYYIFWYKRFFLHAMTKYCI